MKLLCHYADAISDHVLSYENFRLFSDQNGGLPLASGLSFDTISEKERKAILAIAEKALDEPYPQLLASVFIRFYREGNRVRFEELYFERRAMLFRFALAEALEQKGRFLDRIMDGIWLICEESDWVIHAHIPHQYALTPFYQKHTYIDLFAAETGSLLAWVAFLCQKSLDAVTPQICERLLDCLHERIIRPFLERDDMWWMGLSGNTVNNWNPWILSNILTVCALTERDIEVRRQITTRAARMLDCFFDGYHEDGGCNEGPSYWGKAGAAAFDALELLDDLIGGAVELFSHPLIRRMGEYEADFHICDSYFVNFADCPARITPDYRMIARFGRRVHSERLYRFGAMHSRTAANETALTQRASWSLYRQIKDLLLPIPESLDYHPDKQAWYEGLGVMIEREESGEGKGFFLACKGGHNEESHNHNDVGNFIVYLDGKPLILDAGVGTYTKKTFSDERYSIWSMCSDYHNLPTINGVTQAAGRQYCATELEYTKSEHRLAMELAAAYPKEANIRSLRRTVEMQNGSVTVRDTLSLSAPGSAVFTLMLGQKPTLSDGAILLDDARIDYSPSLHAVIDHFNVEKEDDSIRKNWGDVTLWRVLFKTETFTDEVFTLTVTRK